MEIQEIIKRFSGGYVCGNISTIEVNKYLQELIELKSTITAQEDIIKLLKEDAERLADYLISEWHGKDGFTFECQVCEAGFFETKESVKHTDDCLITLHAQLMNELGEKGIEVVG